VAGCAAAVFSSEMILRMEARISSIDGSGAFAAGFDMASCLSPSRGRQNQRGANRYKT
jgi:hypothetical protein